jgi:hypothetical protein
MGGSSSRHFSRVPQMSRELSRMRRIVLASPAEAHGDATSYGCPVTADRGRWLGRPSPWGCKAHDERFVVGAVRDAVLEKMVRPRTYSQASIRGGFEPPQTHTPVTYSTGWLGDTQVRSERKGAGYGACT